jgi:hypothetical protein
MPDLLMGWTLRKVRDDTERGDEWHLMNAREGTSHSMATDGETTEQSPRHQVLWAVGVIASVGLAVFVFLAWRSVTIETADRTEALLRFADVERRLDSSNPILRIEADGTVTRRTAPAGDAPHPSKLFVLAYRVREQRLVHAVLPFWFLKLKGPAVQYALRDTGFDLERLGVTPAALERYGACVVLTETRSNGDRLLVWTE